MVHEPSISSGPFALMALAWPCSPKMVERQTDRGEGERERETDISYIIYQISYISYHISYIYIIFSVTGRSMELLSASWKKHIIYYISYIKSYHISYIYILLYKIYKETCLNIVITRRPTGPIRLGVNGLVQFRGGTARRNPRGEWRCEAAGSSSIHHQFTI